VPIIDERGEKRRTVPRACLFTGAILAALLLLLPVLPCVMPVALHVGDRWLYVESAWNPSRGVDPNPLAGSAPILLASGSVPTPVFDLRSQQPVPVFTAWEPYRVYWFRVGRFYYVVQPFRGHRGFRDPSYP
jgi:hypothetical protein